MFYEPSSGFVFKNLYYRSLVLDTLSHLVPTDVEEEMVVGSNPRQGVWNEFFIHAILELYCHCAE
jgi:hypothetical protein